MTTNELYKRVNYYDFQRVDIEDLETDQAFQISNTAASMSAIAGSGVLLDSPQELVIFDSDAPDAFQQGLIAINAFDGAGVLSTPYKTSDQVGGNQLAIALSGSRVGGFVNTLVFVLGKTFDESLKYEVVELNANTVALTNNHFTEITNLLFQNLRGNLNTTVDGYGCYDVGGRLVVTEASSMRPTRDVIADEFVQEPNIFWRYFKTSNTGKTLQATVQEAIGSSNNIDDLDINTTVAKTRTFDQGGSTDIIYGEKFKLNSNNIQKISILLSLASGSSWSGSLILGVRALQTSETSTTNFLPDDEIGFDPTTEPLEEVVLTQADLANQGIVLTQQPQIVDFVFTGSNLSNPALSKLSVGNYYTITVRRSGSAAVGTLTLQEARNDNSSVRRLTVFSSGVWTDVGSSTLWYRVWSDAARVASGVALDKGVRLVSVKTELNDSGVIVQSFADDIDFASTGEDTENYLLVKSSVNLSDPEAHPRTGDPVFSRAEDVPEFSLLEQDDIFSLIDAGEMPLVLARLRDRNPRSNPTITGTLTRPGLALGNVFTVVSPGSDLLVQNVIGSILTPNTSKPNLSYRITSQTIIQDQYGDVDGDGVIGLSDAALIDLLDGYGTNLSSGTIPAAGQLAALLAGEISIPELLRADVSGNGTISAADTVAINAFLVDGVAMPAGSSFTRVVLEVEPLIQQWVSLDSDAKSTLHMEQNDSALINNTSFSPITFRIQFVPVWYPENVEVLDLRRYISTTFSTITKEDLESVPETGGLNNQFIPGDLYLTGEVKNLDDSFHKLDFEAVVVEIELPSGDTNGEVNIFDKFVVDKMKFSDGTLVSASAINHSQVKFSVGISSYSKNLDGYDFNDGYGNFSDEVIGTYMDHSTGLLRLNCQNVVRSSLFPEIRTRVVITTMLKKAGFSNADVFVDPTTLASVLS